MSMRPHRSHSHGNSKAAPIIPANISNVFISPYGTPNGDFVNGVRCLVL